MPWTFRTTTNSDLIACQNKRIFSFSGFRTAANSLQQVCPVRQIISQGEDRPQSRVFFFLCPGRGLSQLFPKRGLWYPPVTLEPRKAKQVLQLGNPGTGLTLDQLSPQPQLAPAEASGMSQTRGRCHNKKAGIRAAVILIGLLHKSRKAKEKEREREESEGWVSSSQVWGGGGGDSAQGQADSLQCGAESGLWRKLY